jgi:hypothetical protein
MIQRYACVVERIIMASHTCLDLLAPGFGSLSNDIGIIDFSKAVCSLTPGRIYVMSGLLVSSQEVAVIVSS